MNRTQLAALAAAGTAAAIAWGVVSLQYVGNDGADVAMSPPASESATPQVERDPHRTRDTVPAELEVATIAPGRGGTPRGGVVEDVANTPTAVGAALVRTMWTYDTTIDSTSHDAAARAARWTTGDLAFLLARPATRTTPQWDEWTRHDAYTQVGVVGAPTLGQDVETAAQLRTYRVDMRVVGKGSYHDQLEPFLITATLVQDDGRWLVDEIALT